MELHTYAMCAALFLFMATETLLIPARRGQKALARVAFLTSRLAGSLAGAGMLAGVGLVFIGGWSLLTPWLVVSFILIAALMVVERQFVRPWAMQARLALRGTASVSAIEVLACDRRALAGRIIMIALFVLIGALMMMKPELISFAS